MTSPQKISSVASSEMETALPTAKYESGAEPGLKVLVSVPVKNLERTEINSARESEQPMWALSRPAWEVWWQEKKRVRWREVARVWRPVASALQHLLSEPLVRRVSPQHRPEARHEFENVELRAGGWGRVF
ncbi:MAG TPA: hypothetical protein PLZ57_10910 [Pseudobdellovibrionaceae bacterium]|nr:hypothetical protein [Pseudobdellovibrionaceae bacterium]